MPVHICPSMVDTITEHRSLVMLVTELPLEGAMNHFHCLWGDEGQALPSYAAQGQVKSSLRC